MSTDPAGTPPDEADADPILAERARLLAAPRSREAGADSCLEAVEFDLGDQRYAVETAYVQEVLPLKRFCPLPSVPPHVLGIMNVHGRICAVLDTAVLLGLPATGAREDARVILLASGGMEFALLVDRIHGARRIPRAELATPASALCRGQTGHLRAVTASGTILLDSEKMLSDPSLVVRDEASSPEA